MTKLYIKISESRLWIIDYNLACAIFFIPLSIGIGLKLRKKRKRNLARLMELERDQKIRELQKLYRILDLAGIPLSSIVLYKILSLRAGEEVVVEPGVDDCVNVPTPSYIDNERILRFLNDKYAKLSINGIIYVTKEALCYITSSEGIVDFPIAFLERIGTDGFISSIKYTSQWVVAGIGLIYAIAGFVTIPVAFAVSGYIWMFINSINILEPSIVPVDKLTGKYIPRISDRRDAVVFDAKNEPLPPALEDSVKSVSVTTLDTEYEITRDKIVDVGRVAKLKNKFSDIRFRRPRKKGKLVRFTDKIKEWYNGATDLPVVDEPINTIDRLLEEGII